MQVSQLYPWKIPLLSTTLIRDEATCLNERDLQKSQRSGLPLLFLMGAVLNSPLLRLRSRERINALG